MKTATIRESEYKCPGCAATLAQHQAGDAYWCPTCDKEYGWSWVVSLEKVNK